MENQAFEFHEVGRNFDVIAKCNKAMARLEMMEFQVDTVIRFACTPVVVVGLVLAWLVFSRELASLKEATRAWTVDARERRRDLARRHASTVAREQEFVRGIMTQINGESLTAMEMSSQPPKRCQCGCVKWLEGEGAEGDLGGPELQDR
jgi:predicted membrane chloride channel (bestrophin family)